MLPEGTGVASPLELCTPAGAPAGWFVPVVAEERLVAFLRFTKESAFQGASAFHSAGSGIGRCPLAVDWLDPNRIRSRAQDMAESGETAGEPRFTFDGSPEHFAWRVPLRFGDSGLRWVFVAGTTVWRQVDR